MYTTIRTFYSFWLTVCCPGWICFGRIYSPSSGGTTACIQQLVLIILFSWLSVVLVRCTSWWWAVDTPEACRGVWRNILKTNCTSSWFFFKWIYRDARSTKTKKLKNNIYIYIYINISSRNNIRPNEVVFVMLSVIPGYVFQ